MTDIFNKIVTYKSKKNFFLGEHESSFFDISNSILNIKDTFDKYKIKGCRIGLLSNQGKSHVASLVGAITSKNVSVLLSLEWTEFEILKIINHCEIEYLLSDVKQFSKIKTELIFHFKDMDMYLLKTNIDTDLQSNEDDAVIIYSSGTTGTPKGVLLSRKGISQNVKSVIKYLSQNSNDSSLIFTPTCYAFSLSQNLTHLYAKSSLLVIKNKLLFPKDIVDNILKYQITGITGPPAAFSIISNATKNIIPNVRYCQVGGTPFSYDLYRKIKKIFIKSKILNVYGCSENSPRISYFYLKNKKSISKEGIYPVGKSVSCSKILLVDNLKKIICSKNQIGEIAIKSKSIMKGYWKNENLTKSKLIKGIFYTGDRAYYDKYFNIHLVGRIDTMINTGNEKVSPEEVELTLNTHKNILESIVFPISDKLLGSKVSALIVIKDKKKFNVSEVQSYCMKYLSKYKIPKIIKVTKKIKKNLYGKIDRKFYLA